MKITKQSVQQAQRGPDPWRISNQVLYDLCVRYPGHVNDAEIVAKVLLIGRVYAASLERGRGVAVGTNVTNDTFYAAHVTAVLRGSDLDEKLRALTKWTTIDAFNASAVLDTHGYLVGSFETLTDKGKRSLASKYLHFHCPDLFFLMDQRAVKGMRRLEAYGTTSTAAGDPARA